MNFPDFFSFEPFNQLRLAMGASQLGHFTFFDPKHHVSAEEKRQFADSGLITSAANVRVLEDRTLAYKNARVLLVNMSKESAEQIFHVAGCNELRQIESDVLLANQVANPHLKVCKHCLQVLRYEGYDAVRNRHIHYSERVYESFEVGSFFDKYPHYPISNVQQSHEELF